MAGQTARIETVADIPGTLGRGEVIRFPLERRLDPNSPLTAQQQLLVEKFRPMVPWAARRLMGIDQPDEFDEAVGDGNEGLIKGAIKFDKAQAGPTAKHHSDYFYKNITGYMFKGMRTRYGRINRMGEDGKMIDEIVKVKPSIVHGVSSSLEEPLNEDGFTLADTLVSAESSALERTFVRLELFKFLEAFDSLDREIFLRYHVLDQTQAQIGRDLGMSQMVVGKNLRRIADGRPRKRPRPAQYKTESKVDDTTIVMPTVEAQDMLPETPVSKAPTRYPALKPVTDTGFQDKRLAILRSPQAGPDQKQIAFGLIVKEYRPSLVAYAAKIVGSKAIAEDAVQETFISAWRHVGSFQESSSGSLSSWLYAIARNRSLDELRRKDHQVIDKNAEVERALDFGPHPKSAPNSDPAEVVEAKEDLSEKLKYINQLPAQAQQILLLKLAGKKYEEIASITGLTMAAVKSTFNRARTKLPEYQKRQKVLFMHSNGRTAEEIAAITGETLHKTKVTIAKGSAQRQ